LINYAQFHLVLSFISRLIEYDLCTFHISKNDINASTSLRQMNMKSNSYCFPNDPNFSDYLKSCGDFFLKDSMVVCSSLNMTESFEIMSLVLLSIDTQLYEWW
jgi:hypothetical protein